MSSACASWGAALRRAGLGGAEAGAAGPIAKLYGPRIGVLGINHIAFRSRDPKTLRAFYLELTGGQALEAEHDPIRVGHTLLVFFRSEGAGAESREDEIAFDVDRRGFDEVLERARRLGVIERGPVQHTPWSQGLYTRDPEGRRLEFTYDDRSVYWK